MSSANEYDVDVCFHYCTFVIKQMVTLNYSFDNEFLICYITHLANQHTQIIALALYIVITSDRCSGFMWA